MLNDSLKRAHAVGGRSRCIEHSTLKTQANICQFNVTDELEDLMPFRNDDRISEEGYVAETMIHKNVLLDDMETNIVVRTMPFGMCANRWPGMLDVGAATKASAARHGIKFDTMYAVPMSVSVVKIAG